MCFLSISSVYYFTQSDHLHHSQKNKKVGACAQNIVLQEQTVFDMSETEKPK